MFYAINFDAIGHAISRLEYSEDEPVLPDTQLGCTFEQFQNFHRYRRVGDEIALHDDTTLLQQAKERQITAINAGCLREFNQLPLLVGPGEFPAAFDALVAKRIDLTSQVNSIDDATDAGISAVQAIHW